MSSVLFAVLAFPFPLPAATAKPADCNIPNPCALFSNASTGAALHAASAGGFGAFAESGSGSYLAAAVDGESSNPTGNDAGGTFGVGSATGVVPAYGALGYGTVDGLYGEVDGSATSSAAGVFGYSAAGTGAVNGDAGVVGEDAAGTGVIGIGAGSPTDLAKVPVGAYGISTSSNANVRGIGVEGESNWYPLEAYNPAQNMRTYIGSGAGFHIFGDQGSTTTFYVSENGYGYLAGTLTTSKGTYVRERGASGVVRQSYGSRATLPEIEDVGEARLANGRAVVAIDAALADTIDARRGYHVFVTPEDDCKGLYVTGKTRAGFTVRELQGGRSSLVFEYRIVATPRNAGDARLAVAPPLASNAPGVPPAGRSVAFRTPRERLAAQIGEPAVARALRQRETTLRR